MLEWIQDDLPNDRKDPYAVWSRVVRPTDERRAPAVVPVFLKVTSDNTQLGFKEIERLLAVENDKPEAVRRFFISNLESPLLAIRAERSEGPDTLNHRLILLYAYEDALFPVEEGVVPVLDGDEGLYERWFVGSAIDDAVSRLPDNQFDKGIGSFSREDNVSALAVVDDSIAFLNSAFVREAESERVSKFSRLRFQHGERLVDGTIFAGAVASPDRVLELLNGDTGASEFQLYQEALVNDQGGVYRPIDMSTQTHQPLAFPVSHGTAVADAALKAFENQTMSAPRELELFGLTVPSQTTQDTSGQMIGTYLLLAMWQSFLWLEASENPTAPLVINFSFGFTAGPKDGTSELNTRIAELLEARNSAALPTALVVPMGNSALSQTVIDDELTVDVMSSVSWVIEPDDETANFLELYSDVEGVEVTLVPPTPEIDKVTVNLDGLQKRKFNRVIKEGHTIAAVGEWCLGGGSQWKSFGFFALGPTQNNVQSSAVIPNGRWTVEITNKGGAPAKILGMIQRDDAAGTYPALGRQSYFDHAELANNTGKLNEEDKAHGGPISLSKTGSVFAYINSPYVYVVGAGMGGAGDSPSGRPKNAPGYASLGPRINGKRGPDLTELSDRSDYFRGIYCAGTYSGTSYPISGSSISCASVAGYLAAHSGNIGVSVDAWQALGSQVQTSSILPEEKGGMVLP